MWGFVQIPAAATLHPFWIFDWSLLINPEVPGCTIVLFVSGVLCSAAGIGGGGIYVAVLMVLGGISTHNAVPLSKAIVFFGAVASTVLNLRRQMEGSSTNGKAGINFEVCRLVVPMALSGTFLGVLLNFHVPAKVIVILLTCILCSMTVMVVRTAWKQHRAEEEKNQAELAGIDTEAETQPLMQRGRSSGHGSPPSSSSSSSAHACEIQPLPAGQAHLSGLHSIADVNIKVTRETLTRSDVIISVLLILVVVVGGVLRFHMHACRAEKEGSGITGSCRHPFVSTVFGGRMEGWMESESLSFFLQHAVTSLPLWSCAGLSLYYGRAARDHSGWKVQTIFVYQLTALATGLLAGLVGIGGGLVFSPFFLLMGLEPHVAVATSSTCVLFTSSSTTIQYLFTDRIMMSLALLYGMTTLLASWVGTSLVHILQDKFRAKRSYISWLVAAGVAISAGLTLAKLVRLVCEGETATSM
mmetsp:Transcript_17499/g.61149  ORF Transcript_17499/g.61149 Transcript_17499/m.61149 type:complete len:470 (-) Transcript_17499:45-1454(-)